MNIYVDIDDVVVETTQAIRNLLRNDYSLDIPAGEGISLNHLRQLNYLSDLELSNIQTVINSESFLFSLEPTRFAAQTLTKIAEQNSIFFVTGRLPCHYSITQKWLTANNFPYHKLFHFDKHCSFPPQYHCYDICLDITDLRRCDFQCWIEDSPAMIDIMRSLHVENIIVFNRTWNTTIKPGKDLIRANNWKEIEVLLTSQSPSEKQQQEGDHTGVDHGRITYMPSVKMNPTGRCQLDA